MRPQCGKMYFHNLFLSFLNCGELKSRVDKHRNSYCSQKKILGKILENNGKSLIESRQVHRKSVKNCLKIQEKPRKL